MTGTQPRGGNARSSGYERADDDWYVESAHSVDALLDEMRFADPIWDPAAGGGNIPRRLLNRGYRDVVASDIAARGYGEVQDFFSFTRPLYGAQSIVSNPPFSVASEFVLHGLSLVSTVAVLQRTAWLEGEKRYQRLFRHGHLARVLQFRSRVSMPPGGSQAPAKGGSVAYAWFVFRGEHQGAAELGWLP